MTATIDAAAGAQALHAPALLIVLATGVASGLLQGPAARSSLRLPRITLVTTAIVGALFVAQLALPPLLAMLARKPEMLHEGEIWRAITALFVQDSDTAGAVFNLTVLLVLGTVAERQLGPARWLTVYFGGGMISEFLALIWQPYGAGNSIACFALAGALAMRGIRRTASIALLGASAVAMGASLALLLLRDIHGLAYGTGAGIEALLALISRFRRNEPSRDQLFRA